MQRVVAQLPGRQNIALLERLADELSREEDGPGGMRNLDFRVSKPSRMPDEGSNDFASVRKAMTSLATVADEERGGWTD